METGPNLNRIHDVIEAWSKGATTGNEIQQRLEYFMALENYVPRSELVPVPSPEYQLEQVLTILKRVELRLNAIARHLDVPLPDDLNPNVLLDDVRKLVDEGQVIRAIKVHRDRNGAGLAEAKQAVDEYRGRKSS